RANLLCVWTYDLGNTSDRLREPVATFRSSRPALFWINMIAEPQVKIAFQAESYSHFRDLESQIGNTPLLGLRRVARELPAGVEIFVKAEHMNPGGSVKDRAALAMILEGERSGRLYPGKVILDATSGNTGIAYAMVGGARGCAVEIGLPR